MSEKGTCNFKDPGTLKDILELLEKLSESRTLKASVGPKLSEDVKKYFKDAQKFYQSGSRSEFLSDVFSNAYGIRSTILQNSGTQYDKYNDLNDDAHASHKDCALKISNALKRFLPRGYVALYYLYFMCSNDCSGIKGGQWKDQNVNGSGSFGQNLKNWLTKEETILSGYSATKPLTPGLIRRGFSDSELKNSSDGSTVAPVIKKIIKHDNPEALQKALSYLLFSCPWDPALTGHALLFISKFCSMVGPDYTRDGGETFNKYKEKFERKFNGSFDEMQKRCNEVNNNHLQTFLIGSSHLFAVCQKNTGLFNDLWDDKKFEDYVKWLKENLEKIIEALEKMSSEHTTWTTHSFEHAYTAGPFRFGFTFKDNKWQDYMSRGNLRDPIKGLIASLRQLKEFIDTASSGSSSSPGATAGGVFTGLFGLGGAGAGAAYATNAFGFQNLVTSFISSFLK